MHESVHCPHARSCAGCPLIEQTYEQQLAWKRERVRAAFAFYPELRGTAIAATSPAPSATAYRVRAKLMVAPAGAPGAAARLGLYAGHDEAEGAAQEHVVVDIPECRVLTPALGEAATALRRLLRAAPSPSARVLAPPGPQGGLAAIDLREVEHGGVCSVLVTLVLAGDAPPSDAALREAAEAVQRDVPLVAGVAVNYRRRGSPQVLGPTTRVLAGVSEAPDRSGDVYHLATYGAFTQANRAQAQHIATSIAEHLARGAPLAGRRVLDLYAGSGALSLPLAARGAELTLVEAFPAAAQAAARAADRQGLRLRVRQGDAAKVSRELLQAGARFDAVIVDPPRRGLDPEVRRAIVDLAPHTIAYVSCDPDTLARDLSHMARLGYRAMSVGPVDMMPLTDHVETLALLERANAIPPATLHRDADVHVTELLGYEAAAPPSMGDLLAGTAGQPGSGVALWTRTALARASWQEALLASRKHYLVLARGITPAKGSLRTGARYRRAAVLCGHSLLQVSASHHQVDRDLARIGHPIVGDERSGHMPTNRHFQEKYGLDRAFLHVSKIDLMHGGRTLTLTPGVPGELVAVLARLGHAFTSNSPGE